MPATSICKRCSMLVLEIVEAIGAAYRAGRKGPRHGPPPGFGTVQDGEAATDCYHPAPMETPSEVIRELQQRAGAAFEAGRLQEAQQLYARLVGLRPESASFHFRLAL